MNKMADSSDVKTNTEGSTSPDNVAGDKNSHSQNLKPRTMKRSRTGMVGSSTDNSEDSEPDEKRPAFRLQPPTLIHGQAKSVPKSADEEGTNANSSSSKCKFLQPPKLSAPSSSAAAATTAARNERAIGSEPLVSSSNPFLLMAEKDDNNEVQQNEKKPGDSSSDNGVLFGSNIQDRVKVNGAEPSDESQPDSTTDVDSQTKDDDKQENLFLQAASSSSAPDSGSDGFVFGSKMEDRVAITAEVKSPGQEGDGNPGAPSEFVFGQNLSERAKVSSSTDSNTQSSLFVLPSSSTEASSNVADSSVTLSDSQSHEDDPTSQSPSSSNSSMKRPGGLREDAAAHFLASQTRTVMPEVEVKTGEEDEKNVLQMQCKLHQFDAATQNWLERGVGSLHLNDGIANDDIHFQSRLVMRIHGSLRLVLNTKVWAQMTVERASKKSVRVSAQTDDGSIGVFLISATINDAEQIYRALEYRVLHQKQLDEKQKQVDKTEEPSDPASCQQDDEKDNEASTVVTDTASVNSPAALLPNNIDNLPCSSDADSLPETSTVGELGVSSTSGTPAGSNPSKPDLPDNDNVTQSSDTPS